MQHIFINALFHLKSCLHGYCLPFLTLFRFYTITYLEATSTRGANRDKCAHLMHNNAKLSTTLQDMAACFITLDYVSTDSHLQHCKMWLHASSPWIMSQPIPTYNIARCGCMLHHLGLCLNRFPPTTLQDVAAFFITARFPSVISHRCVIVCIFSL